MALADTPIEKAKLNAADPQAWRADTLARIPDDRITRVDDLPWLWLWLWLWNRERSGRMAMSKPHGDRSIYRGRFLHLHAASR